MDQCLTTKTTYISASWWAKEFNLLAKFHGIHLAVAAGMTKNMCTLDVCFDGLYSSSMVKEPAVCFLYRNKWEPVAARKEEEI